MVLLESDAEQAVEEVLEEVDGVDEVHSQVRGVEGRVPLGTEWGMCETERQVPREVTSVLVGVERVDEGVPGGLDCVTEDVPTPSLTSLFLRTDLWGSDRGSGVCTGTLQEWRWRWSTTRSCRCEKRNAYVRRTSTSKTTPSTQTPSSVPLHYPYGGWVLGVEGRIWTGDTELELRSRRRSVEG